MDTGYVFVLVLSALMIGILAFLELRSRRRRQEPENLAPQDKADVQKAPKNR